MTTLKTEKNIVTNKKVYDYGKPYFAQKAREFRKRNKPYFWIEIEGKIYVFRKEQLTSIKPKYVDTLINPIKIYSQVQMHKGVKSFSFLSRNA